MTKYSDPEVQSVLLDLYAMHGTDTTVARLSGVSRVTLWRMSNMSEEGEPSLQECDWGGVIKPYHEHKMDALDVFIEDVQQRMTRDAGQGQEVPLVHGGEYKWEDCEFAMSLTSMQLQDHLTMDDETRELLGVPRVWEDRKKRVLGKTGIWERVRATQYLPPTLDAQSKVLSSFAPETFGDRRRIDLNLSGGLGVQIVGQAVQPPQHLLDITPTVEAITDESVTDAVEIEFTETPTPEPVMSEPFTPDPNSPLTEEQQRILARSRSANPLAAELAARALQKQAAANAPVVQKPIQPPPPSTYKGDDQDDCVPRNPRGMKVV